MLFSRQFGCIRPLKKNFKTTMSWCFANKSIIQSADLWLGQCAPRQLTPSVVPEPELLCYHHYAHGGGNYVTPVS